MQNKQDKTVVASIGVPTHIKSVADWQMTSGMVSLQAKKLRSVKVSRSLTLADGEIIQLNYNLWAKWKN